jgi:NitT/TauT family transport system ATP-binding protein
MSFAPKDAVLEMRKVCMAFGKGSGEPSLPVLADLDITLRDGEILGLLGRSGSGKSTLLRIAAGLVRPTSGQVLYRARPLDGPEEGIAVVFQTFALYPWLTVLENVELGLDALALSRAESRQRALSAVDLIGLDGFQNAYPRELSGGMRQRVGFARALVTGPTLLLMDEPFSALDVLTAELLRTDFLDLWVGRQLPIRSALLVTHNIEEAVLMCERIVLLSGKPARIATEIAVHLPHPRDRLDPAFRAIVDEIYSELTSHAAESVAAHKAGRGAARALPDASVNRIGGLVEALSAPRYEGHAQLALIASQLGLEVNEIFPIAEALHLLEFAELKDGVIKLTAAGQVFAAGDTDQRKQLFREHLLHFVPLAAHIRHVLDEREGHHAPRVRFESELEDHLNEQDTEKTLRAVTGWGRYAELFTYDGVTKTFSANQAMK